MKQETKKKEWKLFDRFMNSLFVNSFSKIDRNFLYVLFVDIILVSLIFLVITFSGSLMGSYIEDNPQLKLLYDDMQTYLSIYGYESIPNMPPEIREKYISSSPLIYSLLMKYIANIIISSLIVILLVSISQAFVWSKLLKKKFNILFFKKFLQLNLLWFTVWLFILTILFLSMKPGVGSIFVAIGIFLFIHFTHVIISLFDEKNKILLQIKIAFKRGIRFNLFIVPWLWGYFVLVLFILLFSLVSISLSLNLQIITGILLFFVYYGWLRIYILSVIGKLKREINGF